MLLLYLNINLSTRISPRHCCNCTRASTNLVEKDCRCNFGRSLTYNNSFDCAITYRLPNISFFNLSHFIFNISPHLNDLLPYLQFQSVPRLLFLQATRSHQSIKPPSPLTNHQWFSPLWVGQLSLGIFYYTYWLPTFHFISFSNISFHFITFPFIFISFSNISFHFQHFISQHFISFSFHFSVQTPQSQTPVILRLILLIPPLTLLDLTLMGSPRLTLMINLFMITRLVSLPWGLIQPTWAELDSTQP